MTPNDTSGNNALPSLEHRVDAIEMLLQQLVLLLEAEPAFTADKLARWTSSAMERMRAHGAATQPQLSALARLVGTLA